MHARYEAGWDEYNRIDEAGTRLKPSSDKERSLAFAYELAMKASNTESQALQRAILYQVPTTWQEALILQFHIHVAGDAYTEHTEAERVALEVATDTLFDFMCDEIDHEDVEGQFQNSEHLVSDRRRLRTGKLGA